MDLQSKLQKSFEKRKKLFSLTETNCFRLFNMDGDGIGGLTIDYYNSYVLVQYFWQELREQDSQIRKAVESALGVVPVPINGVLFKNRVKVKNEKDIQNARKSNILNGSIPPDNFHVLQNNMKMYVDLIGGQSTGIFLDMREVRDALAGYYTADANMLNLFSYTGAFSVHALSHGVKGSINVDLSKTVLSRAKDNYRLNGLAVDSRDFIVGDAFSWIKKCAELKKTFSFIVLDPPTFSRNKKQTFSVKQDYAKMLRGIDEIATGYVLSCINSHSVSQKEYFSYHPSHWKQVFFANESSDFPAKGDSYLKVGLWKV